MSRTDLLGPDPQRMAREVRLVASDLDGTLIGHDFRFRPRTQQALRQLEAAGIPIIFVTGRPWRWLDPLRDLHELGESITPGADGEDQAPIGAVICSNGALVYDFAQEAVVSSRTLSAQTALEVHARLRRLFPQAVFSAETLRGVAAEPDWLVGDRTRIRGARIGPLPQVLEPDDCVVKLLARLPGADPQQFVAAVSEEVSDLVSVTHSVAQAPLAEIARTGLSKAEALAEHCRQRGIEAHEVLAFGDMPNDLRMLQWAGYGYALSSGDPAVVAAVERTAPGFDDDGVAQVIEQLLAVRADL